MHKETLTGGNMDPVIKVGDTVRRVTGPWTAAVHELLGLYAAAGIEAAPHALGLDDRGREILTYIEGETLEAAPPEVRWRASILRGSAGLLRELHDASAPLAARGLTWRNETHDPAEVICHNDFAPYNLIVQGGRLAGVIDFDMASPGSRIWDFAYLAYRLAPYAEDAAGFDPTTHGTSDDRLDTLITAYGTDFPPPAVRRTITERLTALAAFSDNRATQTNNPDLHTHAAMYRRDATRLR
ncbi:phosphotransferase [Glycomyces sp. NPDC046736]|uniref:phosphotransferase n=1 Tax=Glycomyces sp. NPDC046736 TaxID=3155615 RepID=UPI003411AB51